MAKPKKSSKAQRAALREKRRRARAEAMVCGKVVDYPKPVDFDNVKWLPGAPPLPGGVEEYGAAALAGMAARRRD